MADEISFTVDGYPPAKGEALSMLGPRHGHAPRVVSLLAAAREEIMRRDFPGFGSRAIRFELIVRCPRDRNRSDATNYLGGIADVLESKAHRGALEHLGDLANVSLYDNDRQIEEITFKWDIADEPSYEVHFSAGG